MLTDEIKAFFKNEINAPKWNNKMLKNSLFISKNRRYRKKSGQVGLTHLTRQGVLK